MIQHDRAFTSSSTIVLAIMVTVTNASAHFVWLESPSTLPLNEPGIVKAYFGEYNESLRESTGGRLDERAGLTSWMLEPNGNKQALEMRQKSNYFGIPVKPSHPGTHILMAIDEDEPVRDGTPYPSIGMRYKPMFYARTYFSIPEPHETSAHKTSAKTRPFAGTLPLDVVLIHPSLSTQSTRPTVNTSIELQVTFKGQPLAKFKTMAHGPNGWSKELQTNDSGITKLTPLWPGLYVIDCVNLEKTRGTYQDQPYEAIRHRSTLTIRVVDNQ